MIKRPVILVTNDDGIEAPGLKALVEVMVNFGDLVIIAPDQPQSGVGHAITIRESIKVIKSTFYDGLEAYSCSGTPVDCVKFCLSNILTSKPDLLVAGINHGSNASINILYSGTMSAAMEGAIEGIPSIGFSLTDWEQTADMELSKKVAKQVTFSVLKNPLPKGILLNVNIPDILESEYKGIKICKQAHSYWVEKFIEKMNDNGEITYNLTGEFCTDDNRTDTDIWALANNYVSIVPVHLDLTAHHMIPLLQNIETDFVS